ncbi:MAG: L,D-transpeptidase family protein [Verrucomicrobia bacterium]|nr:L,D-transpeptidase family protein [Verrucomicrobiota bacterium]
MKRAFLWLALVFYPFTSSADETQSLALEGTRQILVVTTPDWNAVSGRLRLFESDGNQWKQIESWPIVVGREGLAWGKGVHPAQSGGPQKREGDGKAPAGIFKLSSAFGSEPLEKVKGVKLPYLPLDSMIECVDDVKSTYYNSIVDRKEIEKPDWGSSEKMLAIGAEYRLGIVVDHNFSPRKQGDGSCIFIHIWKNKKTGTAGCTAMVGKHMEKLVRWLDPEKKPLLVQLPEVEYERLQKAWKLPALK